MFNLVNPNFYRTGLILHGHINVMRKDKNKGHMNDYTGIIGAPLSGAYTPVGLFGSRLHNMLNRFLSFTGTFSSYQQTRGP